MSGGSPADAGHTVAERDHDGGTAPPQAGEAAGAAAAGADMPGAARQAPAPSWREPAMALVCCALGGGLVLLAAGRPWVNAVAAEASVRLAVSATGRDISGVPSALGLFALAGGLVMLAAGRLARQLVGVLLAVAGGAIVAACIDALANPATAAASRVAAVTSGVGVSAAGAQPTFWIALAVAGGVVVVAGGILTVLRARAWPRMSARYERSRRGGGEAIPAAAGTPAASVPRELWSALDRGEDPTAPGG